MIASDPYIILETSWCLPAVLLSILELGWGMECVTSETLQLDYD